MIESIREDVCRLNVNAMPFRETGQHQRISVSGMGRGRGQGSQNQSPMDTGTTVLLF